MNSDQVAWHQRRSYLVAVILLMSMATVGPWPQSLIKQPDKLQLLWDSNTKVPPVGPLNAGAAKVDITALAADLPLAGYGKRAFRANTGVADNVGVRALVLDNTHKRIAIISADLLIINRLLADQVLRRLNDKTNGQWRRADLFFTATHTHSSVAGYPGLVLESLGLGRFRPIVVDRLARRIVDAILQAERSLQPAEFASTAITTPPGCVRNRTDESGLANRWFDLLAFRNTASKEWIATVPIFTAHATCRRSKDCRVSADYPGVLMRAIEKEHKGVCLFSAGAVGSMAPATNQIPRDEWNNWLGSQLAAAANEALSDIGNFEQAIVIDTVGKQTQLPPAQIRIAPGWCLAPVAADLLLPTDCWIHGLRIGQHLLVGTPTDYSGVLADELRGAMPGFKVTVTSFNGDYIGYVLPDDYYDLDKYEPRQMAFYGPSLGSRLQSELRQLIGRLAQ